MKNQSEESNEAKYRIGAVSRLTRIPTDTLRVWERRYGVVEPFRSEGGGRLYTQDDINRLDTIKRLVEAGHAIGTIANLSIEKLNHRLAEASSSDIISGDQEECRLLVIGETLTHKFSEALESASGIELVGAYNSYRDYENSSSEQQPNIIMLEYPTLHENNIRQIHQFLRESNAKHCILVYGFGNQSVINQLEHLGLSLLKFPVTASELQRACREHMRSGHPQSVAGQPISTQAGDPLPPRIYSREQLAKFASISTAVKCECPQHLADLILNLDSFELYSLECENSNADDAALHAYLHQATARARSIMEEALKRVAEAEELDVGSE